MFSKGEKFLNLLNRNINPKLKNISENNISITPVTCLFIAGSGSSGCQTDLDEQN